MLRAAPVRAAPVLGVASVRMCSRWVNRSSPATRGRQRTRGHRAAGRGHPADPNRRRRRRPAARRSVADGGPAGRRLVRHPGACRAGDHRPTGRGSAGGAADAIRRADRPARRGLHRRAARRRAAAGAVLAARPARPRGHARRHRPARSVGGDWTSRSRWPAATESRRASRWARSRPCCAVTWPRTIRLPGTPIGWPRRRTSGNRCAGTSPAAWTLVIRLPGPRYLVADYKTNWLGDVDAAALSAWHYRPAALDEVMAGSDYPLQAMLYCVALHRFLRWRQPGYDPADTHRRGAVPVRPGHVRPGDPAGGRPAVWRVRLAAAGGTDHRAVRPAGRRAPTAGGAP